jgi:hypothetical protein
MWSAVNELTVFDVLGNSIMVTIMLSEHKRDWIALCHSYAQVVENGDVGTSPGTVGLNESDILKKVITRHFAAASRFLSHKMHSLCRAKIANLLQEPWCARAG